MPSPEEDLQAAADRGDLERTTRKALNEQHQQQLVALTNRRWIVMQVVEIAKAGPMTPSQFKELCEYTRDFIAGDPTE
jgi:hypothetical protein